MRYLNSRSHKRFALLAFSLLIGLCLCCFLWVRKEQRQYALNRQLIEALKTGDIMQIMALLEAGADPNTRLAPSPFPTWTRLLTQLLFHSYVSANRGPTALMFVCGTPVPEDNVPAMADFDDARLTRLTKTMLTHGADANAIDSFGDTALHWIVFKRFYRSDHTKELYRANYIIIGQLLTYGADPNSPNAAGITPLAEAQKDNFPALVALLQKYSKRP